MANFKEKPYAQSCIVKSVAIWRVGEADGKPYANLRYMATHFQYHESILWPSYGATIVIVDNAENLMASMPLQGGEKVVVEVEDVRGDDYSYEFRVWKINNRMAVDRGQIYTLMLISEEGLINEATRVNRSISGTTSNVVSELLTQYLNVVEGMIDSEPSANSVKLTPPKKTPYSVIREFCPKTISVETFSKKKKKNNTNEDNKSLSVSDVSSTNKATGTAGYFFFQTRKGFTFKSIDSLISVEPEEIYNYSPGRTDYESLNKIQEVQFGGEIDMMKKMREGAYSSIVCFFNINTGKYEEYVYSLKDTWDDMLHLGSQTKLPSGQTSLSQNPTRVMSTIVNHENWYNGTGIASNEDSDLGDQGVVNVFSDMQKQYLSQGIARTGIMFNQELIISLTGHLELCAGDTIEIRIPNQVPDMIREDDIWDPEHSGTYLIKTVNQQIDISDQNVYTVLELIRDSYGIKSKESNVS